MKRDYAILCIVALFILSGCKESTAETSWPEITQESKPWTRWWWLGNDVDSVNLTYNLEALSRAGIGGVEITPLYGVKGRESHYIDFLSPRWMNMLAFTESEAQRLGMSVDMNNGTGWPFGGPEVTIEDAATKAIFQEYTIKGGQTLQESITVKDEKQKSIASLNKLMAYSLSGEILDLTDNVTSTGKLNWTAPQGKDYKLIAFFIGKTLQQVKRAAPGGQGYVLDHLNKEAVKRYFDKFDKAFAANNTPFPHSFFNDSYEVYGADWTPGLLNEFEQRRGYRLQDYFPELLADGATDNSARVIADYRETVGDLLRENFTQVWTEWVHSHGATNRNQAHGSPANLLDLYALVDIPECESYGITDFDIPGLRKDSIFKRNDSSPAILKYASSAAHITGKKYTSSETLTWLTEHFRTSLSQCKPEVDLMFASGVNHVFFHGSTYSPKEAEWPGWKFYAAVDMSPTNTIWRDAPAFFDYIARTQSFLQSGTPDNDFLLYFPMYDIWHNFRGNYFLPFAIHDVLHQIPEFTGTVEQIMKAGFDLDYISDRFLQTTTVKNGLLKTDGGTIYKALIIPSTKYIPDATLARIEKLKQQGATVIFDGKTDIMTEISSKYNKNREIFISEKGGQLIRRIHETGHIYFLAMLKNNPVDEWIALGTPAKSAMIFDPMTGKKGKAQLRNNNGTTEVYLQLQPGESIILKTFTGKNVQAEDWNYYQPTGKKVELNHGWNMYFIDSTPPVETHYSASLPELVSWTELQVQGEGLKVKGENADSCTLYPVPCTLMGTALYELKFDFKKESGKEYRLALGDVRESAVVKINGKKAGTLFAVPFEINIGNLLQTGENTIAIEVTNLPANRIADYDRRGVEWRIFQEINFVDITYSGTKYDTWKPLPSGLLGPVAIQELSKM
ncbi:glycosyl hydrolase family 2 [Bacteroidia bacterium]|nr:glycosyl hydrolase family 2 [Bacteroidia bacterium]